MFTNKFFVQVVKIITVIFKQNAYTQPEVIARLSTWNVRVSQQSGRVRVPGFETVLTGKFWIFAILYHKLKMECY